MGVTVWAEGHPEDAVAQLSFYNEGTGRQGFKPLATRGAGIRTRILALSGARLLRVASCVDG